MKSTILLILNFAFLSGIQSQNKQIFCKAVQTESYNQTERYVKKQIREFRNGTRYFNGEGSGYQISFTEAYDTIVSRMKQFECVEDAFSDKCAMKIAIYPGSSSIGVILKSGEKRVEKCFHIQEGSMGRLNIFGWRPRISKSKNILIYKKMHDCNGFVEEQKKNCNSV
jgi:hypothetical protein